MASPEPPHDVWQLAERAANSVPLNVKKMEVLLGTAMRQDPKSATRWKGGTVKLSPSLEVRSSGIGIGDEGIWTFAGFDVATLSCISNAMLKEHYPSAELRRMPTGRSAYETFDWEVQYEWGVLGFGMSEKDQCLVTIYLNPANAPQP